MPDDLVKLQGTWNVTSFEADGRKMPAGTFEGARIVVEGDRFTSIGMGATYEGTIEIDQTKKPKTLRLLVTGGHAAGTRNVGIYELAGDRWTICLATRGTRRPRRFVTKPGTGFALETLERGRPGAKRPAARSRSRTAAAGGTVDAGPPAQVARSGEPTAWEGEWAMVAAVFNGTAMGESMVKWCRRITHGEITSVVAGPQVMLKAKFALDASQKPPAVDYLNLEGTHAGEPQAGIFELTGDTLKVCMAAPGRPRPGDFSSRAGDGRSYTTWRLVKS